MRIENQHGYFKFFPMGANDIARFAAIFDVSLVRIDDYYTFEYLKDCLKYSIEGKPYLNLDATITCEGDYSEVFRLNEWVYDYETNSLVNKLSVNSKASFVSSTYCFISDGLLKSASLMDSGDRLTGYGCIYDFSKKTFNYYWLSYE